MNRKKPMEYTVNQDSSGPGKRTAFGRRGFGLVALVVAFHAGAAQAAGSLEVWPDISLFGAFDFAGLDGGGLGPMWIMVAIFAVLIFPLNALIYQPIFSALDARAERIQGARNRSAQLQSEADSVLERYETAIREARSDSEVARQAQLASAREEQVTLTDQARGEAEQELDRARSELARSLGEARETLRASADDLATAAAEQVLGRTLS